MATAVDAKRVQLGELLSQSSRAKVYVARLPGGVDGDPLEVVAKCANAANPEKAEEAEAFLEAEAAVYEDVAGSSGLCGYLGEAVSNEGERCLLFERVRALDGTDGPPNSLSNLLRPERRPIPISPRDVLRQLLTALGHLHRAGYVHQDVNLKNILLEPILPKSESPVSTARVKLSGLGSAVSVEGCNFFERMLQSCEIDRPQASKSSPLYAPSEQEIDPEHPFAFDIYAAAICFLQLVWAGVLDDDEALKRFRAQLVASGGDLERWLRTRLRATVVPQDLSEGLARFPGEDLAAFAVVRAMLSADPAKRPSVDALLAHPFLAPTAQANKNSVRSQGIGRDSSLEALLKPDGCWLPGYDVEERPLAVRVQLTRPLGLKLGKVPVTEGGGLVIDDILPFGSGAACDQLRVGDRLVSLDETSLRGMSYNQAMAAVRSVGAFWVPKPTEFLFERTCTDPESCELPEGFADTTDSSNTLLGITTDSSNTSLEAPMVSDSGSFATIGGRSQMEDTYVVTSFNAATVAGPRTFVLAAVFDGHRGGAASAHAAGTLPAAVSAAIAEGEPSPLAVAWRRVVDSYLESGEQDGSTATAVLLGDSGIAEFLNCGDSRTVVGTASASVLYSTRDHEPGSDDEVQRIRASGGSVECGVGGTFRVKVNAPTAGPGTVFSVGVARALGGSEWVEGRISNAADVSTLRLPADTHAIVLASDGLWGVLSGAGGSVEAIERVHAARRKGLSAGDAAQQLVDVARERGSDDNCVAVVLYMG